MSAVITRTEPITGLKFMPVVDLGSVQEATIDALQAHGEYCVVTGCTDKARADHLDQIRYDIIPADQILLYVAQCQARLGAGMFNMSAYPAKSLAEARQKVQRLDGATTGSYHREFQSKALWRTPKPKGSK